MDIYIAALVGVAISLFMHLANRAAYRNGCNDGYGFSKEPNNPGYREAGKILLKRWPEIERRIREEKPVDWE
jgi:hypothetical protein